MLAYRHLFHAGNFADVFKHAVLARILAHLNKKDKPYFYLDTHAGIGLYDLRHAWAQKNREFAHGIAVVLAAPGAPAELSSYLRLVRAHNPTRELTHYPGSPCVAKAFLRAHDRMVLSELNQDDCGLLARQFQDERSVHVHCMDGYQALKAFLPPPERRGLVLVDSSFDRAQEYRRLVQALDEAYGRWATGVYALWYPLMAPPDVARFERQVVATHIKKILRLELSIHDEHWGDGLRGSALLVVNPPWGLYEEAQKILPWLWRALCPDGGGGWDVRWLVSE